MATRRVGDILRHLRRVHEDETDGVTPHNDFASWVDELDQPTGVLSAWRDLCRRSMIKPHLGPLSLFRGAISKSLDKSPFLPQAAIAYLGRCLANHRYDMEAADWLLSCRSAGVADHAARAWGERIDKGWDDAISLKLRAYLASEGRGLDGVRSQLAHANAQVRLAAIDLLADAGTLDDIAFLSDLVAIPRQADEDLKERTALLDAMWHIAHRD